MQETYRIPEEIEKPEKATQNWLPSPYGEYDISKLIGRKLCRINERVLLGYSYYGVVGETFSNNSLLMKYN